MGAKSSLKILRKTLDIGSNWVYTGCRKRRKEQVTAFKESKNRYYVL